MSSSPIPAPAATADRIDWRLVLMLPPKRRFSAEELERALPARSSRTLAVGVALNLGLPVAVLLLVIGRRNPWSFSAVLLGFVAAAVVAALAAWRNPSSRRVHFAVWTLPLAVGVYAGWANRRGLVDTAGAAALALLVVTATIGLWMAVVHRTQYVQMRLAELAERERAIEMARRLAAAQLEPHFLFNTLASLQHWVQTRDERAAGLLGALVGYLRATLPMFARPTQSLADELTAVRHYLEVMRLRLGARLAFSIEVPPQALHALALPPGLLLTLVENAVAHGIEPQLGGGTVRVAARIERHQAVLEVRNSGAGLAADARDGTGLANCRERLALTHGAAARLDLADAPGGGCVATVRLPVRVTP